jgi:hypothetical protein
VCDRSETERCACAAALVSSIAAVDVRVCAALHDALLHARTDDVTREVAILDLACQSDDDALRTCAATLLTPLLRALRRACDVDTIDVPVRSQQLRALGSAWLLLACVRRSVLPAMPATDPLATAAVAQRIARAQLCSVLDAGVARVSVLRETAGAALSVLAVSVRLCACVNCVCSLMLD